MVPFRFVTGDKEGLPLAPPGLEGSIGEAPKGSLFQKCAVLCLSSVCQSHTTNSLLIHRYLLKRILSLHLLRCAEE